MEFKKILPKSDKYYQINTDIVRKVLYLFFIGAFIGTALYIDNPAKATKKRNVNCDYFKSFPNPYEEAQKYFKENKATYLDRDNDGQVCETLKNQ